jgi:hypothetical protein
MPLPYTSRELSERVEIDVQKRPNRFRRRTWWLSLWMCVATLAWLAWKGAEGDYHIFEGGDVATVHRMFENDCAKCHTEWGPLDRVLGADLSSHVYSVKNSACLNCHAGAKHYPTQHAAIEEPSCASCHHDHQGDIDLKRISDQHCLNCHSDLKVYGHGEYTESEDFAGKLSSFEILHPEFGPVRLATEGNRDFPGLSKDWDGSEDSTRHGTRQLVEWGKKFTPQGVEESAWIDRSGIKFNHRKHLNVTRDGDDLVWVIDHFRDEKNDDSEKSNDKPKKEHKRFRNINQLCAECHQEAPDGRYMLPIVYEQHCQTCHGLFYEGGESDQLPHESPGIVMGYLTDRITLDILKKAEEAGESAPTKPSPLARNPGREIPGRRPPLRNSQAKELSRRLRSAMQKALEKLEATDPVPEAERKTVRATHAVAGVEARGSCSYCHTVKRSDEKNDVLNGSWQIVGPRYPTEQLSLSRVKQALRAQAEQDQSGEPDDEIKRRVTELISTRNINGDTKDDGYRMIPSRWMPHAQFNHNAHQMMNCAECHDGAVKSSQTADILLPSIELCRKCHSSSPEQPRGEARIRHQGARTDCVECHTYHDHARDDYTSPLNTVLGPSKLGLDAILTDENTN